VVFHAGANNGLGNTAVGNIGARKFGVGNHDVGNSGARNSVLRT